MGLMQTNGGVHMGSDTVAVAATQCECCMRVEFMTRYTIYMKLCFTTQFVTLRLMLVAVSMDNNQLFYCVEKYFV